MASDLDEFAQFADILSNMKMDFTAFHNNGLTWFCVLAQLQLAFRHPENVGASFCIAEEFARKLERMLIDDYPELTDVIRKGWNPKIDI